MSTSTFSRWTKRKRRCRGLGQEEVTNLELEKVNRAKRESDMTIQFTK